MQQVAEVTERKLATLKQVAAALEVSLMSIYRLLDTGALPSVKVNRSRRIPWQAVDQYIEQNTKRVCLSEN